MLIAEGPSVTDWLQGVGTSLGVPLSFIAVMLTYGLLRHELRTRRAEEADAREAQARLVWGEVTGVGGVKMLGWTGVRWTVHNHSPAPICDAVVFVTDRAGGAMPSACDDLPSVINPGDTASGRADFLEIRPWSATELDESGDHAVLARLVSVNVIFDDNHGHHWTRYGSGTPIRTVLQLAPNELAPLLAEFLHVPLWLRRPSIPVRHAREKAENWLRRRIAARQSD